MKQLFIWILIVCTVGCNNKKETNAASDNRSKPDTVIVIKRDTVFIDRNDREWQVSFGLTHDPAEDSVWFKPVEYYLSDNACSGLASDFYYGFLRPSDNGVTDELLQLATTDNAKLRPFYRWCLDKTIFIQDGALGEHTGQPARRYAEKFPKEFFSYMDADNSGEKYGDWVSAIEYSGFYEAEDFEKPAGARKNMANAMKANCKNCDAVLVQRIEKFAKDCFN